MWATQFVLFTSLCVGKTEWMPHGETDGELVAVLKSYVFQIILKIRQVTKLILKSQHILQT